MPAATATITTTTLRPPPSSTRKLSSRMYAVQATSAHPSGGSHADSYDAQSSTMSRVPIAALLRSEGGGGGGSSSNSGGSVAVDRFAMHGRSYYKYRNDMYNFPADDVEHERLDIMHKLIYFVALNQQLHLAAVRSSPRRILDVGFGSGFWMFDMERQYPTAEIIGIDLDSTVLETIGNSRCAFKAPVDFAAPQWPVEDSSVDFCHMAQLCGCVPNWLELYSKAYRCLRPGKGQIEHVEIDWAPRTSQPQFPVAATDLHNWWYWMQQASHLAGKPIAYRDDTEDLLEQAGFVDVSHKRVRIPLYVKGRNDKQEWALAHGYQTAMGHIGTQSFTGFSMALFTRYLNFTPQQVQQVCEKAVNVINLPALPLYINLHVWTARRPQS